MPTRIDQNPNCTGRRVSVARLNKLCYAATLVLAIERFVNSSLLERDRREGYFSFGARNR
jgi:hypothetical protein